MSEKFTKYIKVASIIEILMGLAMEGFGGLLFWLTGSTPMPSGLVGLILGGPMIILGIFLIIFGINLGRLKKWAWSASIWILIIVIALSIMLMSQTPSDPILKIFFFPCTGAIICLIFLILGRKNFPKE
jgi:predicted neutral ceramidase superfamily lipid hydrolase